MGSIELWCEGRCVLRRALGEEPLALGTDASCDVMLHGEPRLQRRTLLLVPGESGLDYQWMAAGRCEGAARPLDPDRPLRVGERHLLRYRPGAGRCAEPTAEPTTEVLPPEERGRPGSAAESTLRLLVREPGGRTRSRRLPRRPVCLGSAPDNDVVVRDRTVSGRHCRLEPCADGGLLVRDLGSRNGTWMYGSRVRVARLGLGGRLRVGRTELAVVLDAEAASPGPRRERRPAEPPLARSEAMRRVVAEVAAFGALPWPLLLLGESGSGKERLARWLHANGPGRQGPFVALNCGALPPTLLESELFGHERGAFTGAEGCHRGAFEQADGGTLLLDEIGEMPLEQQARLLRVLESGSVRRLGAERERPVQVRIVAATHRDLRQAVAEGRFRADLYCRLARLVARIPPLRERPQDVEALAEAFLREAAGQLGPRRLSPEALGRLLCYRWPGNVRELQNVVLTAAVASSGPVLDLEVVRRAIEQVALEPGAEPPPLGLAAALRLMDGNVSAVARITGLARSTVRARLRQAEEVAGEAPCAA